MRIKVKNLILKETQQTNHQVERFKSRFSVLSSNDITSSEKMGILRNVVTLSNIMLDDKSYAIKLGGFSVNKSSKFAINVNGRFYYRINDDMFKDSTGNEFWAIVRNNKITTFMLRKEIQSTDAATMKDRLRVDEVIFDINKVNSNVEEGLIDEDFESQKVIPALAENMLKNFIKQYVEKVFLLRSKPDRFMVNSFKGLKFKYGKLNDFVANFMLFLEFDDKIGVGGYFQHSPNSGYGTIALNVDPNTLYSVFLNAYKYGDADNNEIMESMYYALRNNDLISVLIHETQHAYDYYISNGKFVTDKSSKEFYKDKRDQTPKSDEKKTAMKVKYLRLKHEVNARFTQAIDDLPTISKDSNDETSISGREYLDKFKIMFKGWDMMTPKIQKYLLRRASQYYYKFREE